MKVKAFLDTNVLMDVLQEGRPNREFSQIILQLVRNQEIEAVIKRKYSSTAALEGRRTM